MRRLLACAVAMLLESGTLAATTQQPDDAVMTLTLSSSAVAPNGMISAVHTCDSRDQSPPLTWTDPPDGTESFALIMDDPDAPVGTWVHWVLYHLPAARRSVEANVPTVAQLPDGARQGRNDFGRIGYGGPCPPPGPAHRYFFKLYALDTRLELPAQATKAQLERAMTGHALAQAELIGRYQRASRR